MPSSVSGNPVESNGSTNPAVDGSKAHRGPATIPLRKARRNECMKGVIACAERNTSLTDGNFSSNRHQAGSPELNFNSFAILSVAATPALVMPLLNFNTQIQPPGK